MKKYLLSLIISFFSFFLLVVPANAQVTCNENSGGNCNTLRIGDPCFVGNVTGECTLREETAEDGYVCQCSAINTEHPSYNACNDLSSPLCKFNPLRIAGSSKTERFSTPGGIVSEILTGYAFPFAGMVLFVMVLWGGFEIMTSSIAGKKDAGRQRITTAIIGFILLFSSYWIAQLVQQIFGVQFL